MYVVGDYFNQYVAIIIYLNLRRHFIKIHFHNKGIDKVNLHNMLHNKLVNSKVPIYFKEKEPPVISYKYTDNISRKVFNYNQTLSDVNLSKYGNWNQSCELQIIYILL